VQHACPARSANRHFKEEIVMTESIADLEKRRDLLKEIKELSESGPDEDYMKAVDDHLATLKQIAETDYPDEDVMKEIDDHFATLKAIEAADYPTDDEIKAASDHLATLKEIEETV
jgi:hypothetical protein